MKKSKLAKAILIAGLSVITAAGVASAAACKKKDKTDDSGKYTSQYTVTFNLNGATGTAPQNQSVNAGSKATEPPEPVWGGHHFTGWYTVPTGQSSANKFDFNTPINQATTLYAGWEDDTSGDPNPVFVVISDADAYTEFCEGGTGGTEVELVANTAVTLDVPSPLQADEYVVAIIPEDYFTVAGSSPDLAAYNRTLSVVIGADTVTYSKTNQFGLLNAEQEPDLRDLSAVSEVTVTSTEAVTVKCALIPASCFSGEEPSNQHTVTFDLDGVSDDITDHVDDGAHVSKPTPDPTDPNSHYTFGGWYKEENFQTEYNFETETVTDDTTIYARWLEDVETTLDPTGFATGSAFTEDTIIGKFTIGSGARLDPSGNGYDVTHINTQGKDVKFTLNGLNNSNSVSFDGLRASSNGEVTFSLIPVVGGVEQTAIATGLKTYKQSSVINESGWEVALGTGVAGHQGILHYTADNLPAGDYILRTSNAARIGSLTTTEQVVKSPIVGIQIRGAQTKFLEGEAFSHDTAAVTAVYGSGRTEVLSLNEINTNVHFDTQSAYQNTPGNYTITVSYTNSGYTDPFTTTYEVYVYDVQELLVYDYTLGAGRAVQTAQRLYKVGDSLNTENIVIHGKATATIDQTVDTMEFLLKPANYSIALSAGGNIVKGSQDVTVSGYDKTVTFAVQGIEDSELQSWDGLKVKVDASASAEGLGLVAGTLVVNRINDALRAFEMKEVGAWTLKTIEVAAGEYKEKVNIDLPNVYLKGLGANAKATTITYDGYNGLLEPNGTQDLSTDGSATVTVTENAEGFQAENITFKNYYNTPDLYNELKAKTSGTQGVAILVDADKVKFKDCFFTGFQDTLYDRYGRHTYENCEIEGKTDYIFGDNSTALFKQCTIRTIGTGDAKNGGYVTCTKGTGGIAYGYIFYDCDFISGENVNPHTVSLGRTWSENNMHIAIINCDIDRGYSLKEYGDSSDQLNSRYGKMNNDVPNPEKLVEYGNRGEGALTAEYLTEKYPQFDQSAGGKIDNLVTILTEAQAQNYYSEATIFAKTNGSYNYDDAWSGSLEIAKITVKITDGAQEKESLGEVAVGYVGGTIDMTVVNALLNEKASMAGDGNTFDKIYTDVTAQQAFDASSHVLVATQTLYVTVKVKPTYKSVQSWQADSQNEGTTVAKDGYIVAGSADDDIMSIQALYQMLYTCGNNAGKDLKTNSAKFKLHTDASTLAGSDTTLQIGLTSTNDGEKGKNLTAGTDMIKITAKTKIKVYVVCNVVNETFSSNRNGAEIGCKIGEGEMTKTTAVERNKTPNTVTIEISLNANESAVISYATKASGGDGTVWFYAIQAFTVD